jgi:aryl-alcohol dehydrogenase-like predicted oxidoreductase
MELRTLPGTELAVSDLCLGTGGLGSTVAREDAFRLLDLFVDLGGNIVDTALVYANWIPGERSMSEKTIGAWLKARGNRARIVVATKGAHPELSTMSIPRLSPDDIAGDVEASLRHLQIETIDLYYLHRDDPARPVEEIVEALQAQVAAGKIRYAACSNWTADRIAAAQAYATGKGYAGFVLDSMLWNLAVVDPEPLAKQAMVMMDAGLHCFHAESGMAAAPYSSQAGGLFQKLAAGTVKRTDAGGGGMVPLEENEQRLARVQRLAAATGLSVTQVVLGYLLSQPFVTVPVVGSRTPAQLQDSASAAGVRLDPAQLAYLEEGSGQVP